MGIPIPCYILLCYISANLKLVAFCCTCRVYITNQAMVLHDRKSHANTLEVGLRHYTRNSMLDTTPTFQKVRMYFCREYFNLYVYTFVQSMYVRMYFSERVCGNYKMIGFYLHVHVFVSCDIQANIHVHANTYPLSARAHAHTHTHTTHIPPTGLQHPVPSFSTIYT